jgi:Family of unknown function (DUF5941)
MSAAAIVVEPPAPPDPLAVYRDDGPIARAIGRELGRELPLPAAVIVLAGLVALLVVVAVGGNDVSNVGAAVVLVWILLTVGASSGVHDRPRVAWAATPLARLTEYVALIWFASLHGASAYPAAYALIAALAFRHYDLVYRLRHRGVLPARWVNALSLGWDGRLLLAYVLLVLGALPAGFYVMAIGLGVAFVGEAVYGWVVVGRVERPVGDEDEEDEL